MEKWVITAKRADFNDIGRRFNIDPVIARCIRNRDIVGDEAIREYLYGDLTYLHDPMLLLNMDKAVRILRKLTELCLRDTASHVFFLIPSFMIILFHSRVKLLRTLAF